MSTLRVEVLDPIKLPIITKLYKAYYPSAKAKRNETIVVGYLNNEIVSLVRLRSIDPYRLLTGMLVVPEHRRSGYAHQLMNACQYNELTDKDYCFAYPHLESFYSDHGFQALEAHQLPTPLGQLFHRYINCGKALIPMQYIDKVSES
ncbi:GNAT family N-acetyltransferase [Vibrio sp. S4M6]|uniref:GNAT family N-acetyltransferase n=1 Tax=Vibrio sinus TaxID=2946865 RepID=UPI00202A8B47|nr:GNAT family N-acetyltransferase [Vibrio sinus]MCL9780375.1 GNAT family N-acetyltransferase [Vibrio sinus]